MRSANDVQTGRGEVDVCAAPTFTLSATSTSTVSYVWKHSTDSITFSATGSDSETLSVAGIADTTYYWVYACNEFCQIKRAYTVYPKTEGELPMLQVGDTEDCAPLTFNLEEFVICEHCDATTDTTYWKNPTKLIFEDATYITPADAIAGFTFEEIEDNIVKKIIDLEGATQITNPEITEHTAGEYLYYMKVTNLCGVDIMPVFVTIYSQPNTSPIYHH